MASGSHGLPKVLLEPAMPYIPFYTLQAGHLQDKRLAAVFYPFGHPMPYASGPQSIDYRLKGKVGIKNGRHVIEKNFF
jgi:hypothetical protein